MSTLTELKNLKSLVNRLLNKVNCACSKPTVPSLPTENGSYVLVVTGGVYTWEPA